MSGGRAKRLTFVLTVGVRAVAYVAATFASVLAVYVYDASSA